jgi:hypothetical protein
MDAWKRIRSNGGSAGIDKQSLIAFEKDLKGNLYRIWNRMSSGSYFPSPVKLVEIPKSGGGTRPLGIPTVSDRVAQMVVVLLVEPNLEQVFHQDSYGYRPNRSAHDALSVARRRCWKFDWVLDMDIKGFFDNINHDLLHKALLRHTSEKWILLYIDRWLKVPYECTSGERIKRTRGVPQGSVIALLTQSPTLSLIFNLKLSVVSFRSVVLYFIKSIIFVKYEKVRELGISSTHQSCVHFAVSTDSFWRCTGRVDAFVWRVSNTGLPLCPTSPRAAGAVTYSGKNGSLHSKTASQPDRSGEIFCCFPWLFHQQSSPGCPGGLFSQARLWKKRRRSLICRSAMIDFGNGSLPRFTGFWFHRLGLSLLPMPARKG